MHRNNEWLRTFGGSTVCGGPVLGVPVCTLLLLAGEGHRVLSIPKRKTRFFC